MKVLALEASTASAKAVLYSTERGVVDVISLPYGEEIGDVISQDPEGVYQTLVDCGKRVIDRNDGKIDAIGLGCIWHSLLLLDKERKPLGRISTWANTTAGETARKYRKDKRLTSDLYSRTGCMIHSFYPLWQYIHLREKEPGRLDRAAYLSSQPQYIFERLTGEWAYSRSTAAGSGMMNIHTLEWDEDILKLAGISRDMVAPLREPLYGAPLTETAAHDLGLDAGIPVIIGGPDGALNQIGGGCMEEGHMTFSVGTSGAIRIPCHQPILPENPSTWCYYLAEGKWIAGAATSGAGNCVEWFIRRIHQGKVSYDELESSMEAIDPRTAPIFLPFLYGERCPGWQDQRKGGFCGLEGSHHIGHLYYALLEGVLMNIYQCYEILARVGGAPKVIQISGGIENSPRWLQMAADIFQREMVTTTMEHASTMGAAALALKAVGGLERLEDFQPQVGKRIIPDPQKAQLYQERFQLYREWYEKTEEGSD